MAAYSFTQYNNPTWNTYNTKTSQRREKTLIKLLRCYNGNGESKKLFIITVGYNQVSPL